MADPSSHGAGEPGPYAAAGRVPDRAGDLLAHLDALLAGARTVLDVDAGDGRTATGLAGPERRVLAVARGAEPRPPDRPHPQVTWLGAEPGALPLADASVDAAYAVRRPAAGSHDLPRSLAELHRVVRPGGPLIVVTEPGDDGNARAAAPVGGHARGRLVAHGFDLESVPRLRPADADVTARMERVTVASTSSGGAPDVTVRGMRRDEAQRVGELTLASYDAYGLIEGDYRDQLGDPCRRVAGSQALLVAESGGEVVGTVTFVRPGDAEWEGRPQPEGDCGFRVLAVDNRVEGRGVGRELVIACIQRAEELGCRRMVIVSMAWMGRAHELYRRLGFERRPDLDVRFPGGDGLVFTLDLRPDAAEHFPPPGPIPTSVPWFEDAWRPEG